MSASNVARHRETLCAECGGVTDGGRYCDVCLPKNQTEQEEAYDREHPLAIESDADEKVNCPVQGCWKEIRNTGSGRTQLRRNLYNHLRMHKFENSRGPIELLNAVLPARPGADLDEAMEEWDAQLSSIGKAVMDANNGEGPAGTEAVQGAADDQARSPSKDKLQSIAAIREYLGAHDDSYSVARLKKLAHELCPGRQPGRVISLMRQMRIIEQDPAKHYVSYRLASDKGAQGLTSDAGHTETSKERTVTCACGKVLCAKSPKSKLTTLVASHLQTKRHEELTDEERLELAKKILPGHSRLRIGGKKGKARTPQRAAEKVVAVEKSAPAAPVVHSSAVDGTQLFFYDNTDGTSVKLPLGGLTDILRELVSGQKCRVLITKQDRMTRAVIEIPEEQI